MTQPMTFDIESIIYKTPTYRGVDYKLYREFGNNLDRILVEKDMSILELSQLLGLKSVESVRRWCRGEVMPQRKNMIALLHHLNISIDELIPNGANEVL